MLDRPRRRRHRLHQHTAFAPAASGAPGKLGDERKRPLLSAEIGKPQRGVGVEHDAQRDTVEVVSLGHHLRANQHTGGGPVEALQDLGCAAFERCDVGIEAEHRVVLLSQRMSQLVLETLGAEAMASHASRPADIAARRHALAVAAVVAGDHRLGTMQHERHVALRAAPDLAARSAGEEVRPATSVQQHNALATAAPQLAERVHRLLVQRAADIAHVEYFDAG